MQLDQNALEAACEAYDAVASSNPRVAYAVSVGMKRAIRAYLQAVQPVPVVADEYASATYTDEQKRKLQADAGIPNIPTNLTYECRLAISGEGERSYDWSDKPHRLVYDLCRQIEALTATASAEPVITDELRGQIAYQLTKRLVIDMPTARACVDDALKGFVHAASAIL